MPSDRLRRREFFAALGGAAASWPVMAQGQQTAMPVIGYLSSVSPETGAVTAADFRSGLGDAGYVVGRNVAVEYRWAERQLDRLPGLAAELVHRQVNVIATPGDTPAALAAKAATTTIPIVFSIGGDPVQNGLVASLIRPGGNATGFTELGSEVATKRLGILHEVLPQARRFALLLEPGSPSTAPSDIEKLRSAASTIGSELEIAYTPVTIPDIDKALSQIVQKRIEAVIVQPSRLFGSMRFQLAELAARHALPVMYWDRGAVEAGGLISYGSNVRDQFRQVGVYAGRILKGEKPANLPVQQATKFELVLNMKAAKALGLDIPANVLALADEIIE
jgi:putative ABC transport system substrate-binding protein